MSEKYKIIKSKNRILLVCFCILLVCFAVVSVFSFVLWREGITYRNALENRYQKNYMQLLENVDSIEVDLSKLVATTSKTTQKAIMQSIYTSCVSAGENLCSLPLNNSSLSTVNNLVNRLGGYMYSFIESEKIIEGDSLKSVVELHDSFAVIKYDLNKGYGQILLDKEYLSNASNDVDGSSFTAGLISGEGAYGKVPTLIYDGPFSESVLNKQPKVFEEEISFEDAERLMHDLMKYWHNSEAVFVGETSGKLSTFDFKIMGDNEVFVQILKNGGKVLSVTSYGNYVGVQVSEEEAVKIAKEMAYNFGYVDMIDVWKQVVNNVVYINLAPIVDGVIYYSDLVKIKIDLNGGGLIGLEGTNYVYNHYNRDAYQTSLSILEAEQCLSEVLSVQERNYCVIPNEFIGESNAFEYRCTWAGYVYYIYLDANTGKELKIMRVIETDNGALLG